MPKRQKRSIEQDFVWSILQGLGTLLLMPFRALMLRRSNQSTASHITDADLQRLNISWGEVLTMMSMHGPSHFRMAIMQADSIVDLGLKALGVPGNTMGERLKAAEKKFQSETYQMVWQAHKVRNRVAHEIEHEVMSWEARDAVASFELALREIHILKDGV